MTEFTVKTGRRTEMLDITSEIESELNKMGVKNGTCLIFVPHTTAGITINENADPDVRTDIENSLDDLIPWNNNYRHREGNSAAHIKTALIGSSESVIIEGGRLKLGRWQSVFFCEFDGPRTRTVFLKLY